MTQFTPLNVWDLGPTNPQPSQIFIPLKYPKAPQTDHDLFSDPLQHPTPNPNPK